MSAPLRIRRPAVKAVGGDPEPLKSYYDRFVKLIPAEALTFYAVGSGIIAADQTLLLILWSLFCLVATVVIRAFGTADKRRNLPPDWVHVTISTLAFCVWIYHLGGPFIQLGWHSPQVSSLLIIAFSFAAPYFYRGSDND